jgi:hypothetical protein
MKKIIGAMCALLMVFALTLVIEFPTSATTALQESFTARYGSDLVDRYSCGLCHPAGSFTELNDYGDDLANAIIDTGGCLDFYPPNTHHLPWQVRVPAC